MNCFLLGEFEDAVPVFRDVGRRDMKQLWTLKGHGHQHCPTSSNQCTTLTMDF